MIFGFCWEGGYHLEGGRCHLGEARSFLTILWLPFASYVQPDCDLRYTRGIAGYEKRRKVFNFLKRKSLSNGIIFAQETHSSKKM